MRLDVIQSTAAEVGPFRGDSRVQDPVRYFELSVTLLVFVAS